MITLDSPVTTVLGDKATKRKRLAEGLGIETVGDLLRHFPRRYVKTGELTHVADLQPGEMITVVGEIAVSELRTYRDKRTGRPAYRLETVLQTDGPRLKMTFFAKSQGTASWQAKRLSKGRRGVFGGQVSTFRGEWQLTNPHMVLFGPADVERGRRAGRDGRQLRRPLPDLPADQGRRVLGHPARGQLRPLGRRRRARGRPRGDPRRVRRRRRAHGRRPDPRAGHVRPGRGRPSSVPLRGGAGHAGRARAQACVPAHPGRPGPLGRRRSAGGVRRAAAVRPHRRAAGGRRGDRGRPGAAPPDEPPAPGRGRLRQDRRRAPGHAARRRLGRPGRAARADRGARPAALPLHDGDARRPRRRRHARRCRRRHDGRAAHRVDAQGRAGRGHVADGHRRGRHRHRHPRPARGEGHVRRPRPGGRRRAAPVRRRAAGRAHRQGGLAARTCS